MDTTKKTKKKNTHYKRNYIVLFVASLGLISISFFFQDKLTQFTSLGLLGIFLINLFSSITMFLPAPGIATVVAGGFLYNPILVALVSAFGSAIGDFVAYLLGRSGKEVFIKKNSFWFNIFKETFHKYGALFIIVFSLVPNPVFDAVGLVAGLFSYSPLRFFVYVFIGRFLRNLLLAGVGSML